MIPGYHSTRAKELELKAEREATSDDDGLDRARDLDADEIGARAERRRLEREATEHAHDASDDPR